MTNYVVLDREQHARTRVITDPGAAGVPVAPIAPVTPQEFASLIAHYPIFFRKNRTSGRFEPCVLSGFAEGENLFLTDQGWDAPYVPLEIQRQPFLLRPKGAGGSIRDEDLVLALDVDDPRVQEAHGEVLFLADGQPSRYLDRVASVLRGLLAGGRAAYAYTAALADLDLIESVQVEASFADGSEAQLDGLYAIDAARLRALRGAELESLQAQGFLEWAYLQGASLARVTDLIARRNRRSGGRS